MTDQTFVASSTVEAVVVGMPKIVSALNISLAWKYFFFASLTNLKPKDFNK